MEARKALRPSPPIVIAVLALVAALAGTALAGPNATTSAISKKKVKKIAKRQAKKQIEKLAPGLSVAHADTTASADTAANANALGGKPPGAYAASVSERYREVDTPGQPSFQGDWANQGAPFSTAAFYRDPLRVVHLKGDITGTPSTVAFRLPPGYRPPQDLFMPAAGTDAFLVIERDGEVKPTCSGAGCTVGIDGLTFRVP